MELGGNEYDKPKPDKQGIIRACQLMNVSHDDCIYVGDTHTDVLAAIHAGAYAVAYMSNPKREDELTKVKPNRLITDLAELDDILKEDHAWSYNMM